MQLRNRRDLTTPGTSRSLLSQICVLKLSECQKNGSIYNLRTRPGNLAPSIYTPSAPTISFTIKKECALASSRNTYESWASSGKGQVQMSLYVSEGLELVVIYLQCPVDVTRTCWAMSVPPPSLASSKLSKAAHKSRVYSELLVKPSSRNTGVATRHRNKIPPRCQTESTLTASATGECRTTITLTPRESLRPDAQGGLIKAIDQGVGRTLNNYTSLLHKPSTSKKALGFGSEHALSTVAIPNEAGLPVTDWYMRTAVGMVHISMYMRGYAIIWYANFFNTDSVSAFMLHLSCQHSSRYLQNPDQNPDPYPRSDGLCVLSRTQIRPQVPAFRLPPSRSS